MICRALSLVCTDDHLLELATVLFNGLYEHRRRALLDGIEP